MINWWVVLLLVAFSPLIAWFTIFFCAGWWLMWQEFLWFWVDKKEGKR